MGSCRRPAVLLAVGAALAVAALASLLVVGRPQVWGEMPLLTEDEAALVLLINDYRLEHGLSTLEVSPTLTAAARWMSEDMAEHNRLSHTDSLGRVPSERMAAFGYTQAGLWGEMIRAGSGTAEDAFEAWRNSPGHNAVMLTDGFVAVGVAKAYNPQSPYGWFWTADFGDYGDSVAASFLGSPTAVSTPTPTPSRTPVPGRIVGCPAPGKWSLAVWTGGDGIPTGEALATCGAGTVDLAYYIDPDTQEWLRYYVGRTEISDLLALDSMRGFFAHGPDPEHHADVSSSDLIDVILQYWGRNTIRPSNFSEQAAAQDTMHNCAEAGKWAISVWDGPDGADIGQALATCGAGTVAAAYYIDPDTQLLSRWFAGRPEVSDLLALNDMQAVIALGADTAP
jgi:uncharacterized protein YkwD